MFLPVLLIAVAGLSAGAVAYGMDPGWAQYSHGLDIIVWTRSLQWPLISISILSCILLIALAVSGRRRPWWLLGLLLVLGLFLKHFAADPSHLMRVIDGPTFVPAGTAGVDDSDWVVGIQFGGPKGDSAFAYPYASLYSTPVILQSDHEKRLILLWCAYANRVLAIPINQELKGRDLEVVSSPANALLLYNSRNGEFINALIGQTTKRARPAGFNSAAPLQTWKMNWKEWRTLHPDTQVLANGIPVRPDAPRFPAKPIYPMFRTSADPPSELPITMIGTTFPLAFESQRVTAAPLNAEADGIPVAVYREHDQLRAFDRRTLDSKGKLDLILHFVPNLHHKKMASSFLIDTGSNTGWTDGVCVDAPNKDSIALKGHALVPLTMDEGLPFDVMKFWYPDLRLEIPPAAPIKVEPEEDPDANAGRTSHPRHQKPKPKPKPGS